MQIKVVIEHELSAAAHAAISQLRNACFPEHQKERSYFKQIPHFRLLAHCGESLVGHLGVDHRVMNFGGVPHSVFGLIDLCVSPAHRSEGIAHRLLAHLEALGRESGVDLLLLLASDQRLYRKNGFIPSDLTCTWLRLDDHKSYGETTEDLTGELMLKPLRDLLRIEGPVDFLGYLY